MRAIDPLGNTARLRYAGRRREIINMTIHLPNDLESRLQAVVQNGRFASVDDAMAEAARLLLREIDQRQQVHAEGIDPGPDPFLGSMRDAADELDQIVADVYRRRREDTWRDIAVE
jgi:Arc/MetJ-type ribon-helix-helix transcriptional regulator